jgi:hypothetical protein
VRELILIAQDTTDYGHDLGMKDGLAILLEQLTASVPDMDWIRIMYAYPGYVTDRLIDVMASSRQVLPYLDMPLQHAHPKTLYRMRRPSNIDWVHRTLGKMRSTIPNRDRGGVSSAVRFCAGDPLRPRGHFPVFVRAGYNQRTARRPGPGGGQAGAL